MQHFIQGKYRSTFSTQEIEQEKYDLILSKLVVCGKKQLTQATQIPCIPENFDQNKFHIESLPGVEITYLNNSSKPIRANLSAVQWSSIHIHSEQVVDGQLYGILEAEIVGILEPIKASNETNSNDALQKSKNQLNQEIESEVISDSDFTANDLITQQNANQLNTNLPSGCWNFLTKGCLNFLLLLFLILALLYALNKCSGADFRETDNEKSEDSTSVLDTLKLKETIHDTIGNSSNEKVRMLALPNVQFYTNSDELLPSSKLELDALAKFLLENLEEQAIIIGHTDNVGNPEKNLKLSQKRAESVKSYLITKGISAKRLQAIGKGASEPKASNNTIEGRLMNRRVEVKLIHSNNKR